MDFSRIELINFLGKKDALSFFIKLRKDELGYFKTIRCKRATRFAKEPIDTICPAVFFNPNEIIAHYQRKIEKYISDPFLVARPLYIQSWEKAIRVAEHFKDSNNDT